MGSSRKHGKDRERDAKDRDSRKRRHVRSSRSRERDQPSGHRTQDGQTSSSGRHGRGGRNADVRSSRDSRLSSSKRARGGDGQRPDDRAVVRDEQSRNAEDLDSGRSKGGGGDVSLSIGETNKLRAKLGLKPLEGKDGSSGAAAGSTKTESGDSKKDEFVHKPAESLTDKRFVEKMREKLAVQKQKREFMKKLDKVRGITVSDSEDDDCASNWVHKSRLIEIEKRKAEERAKMLEEMDAEFGIGNLVENEFRKIKGQAYSAKDLRGLTVQHAQSSFAEGKVAILTLKDKGVLDEDDGDVLVNVNIVDDERAAKNVEVKKGKPTYTPYDDDDIDDYGRVIDKSLLSKYDEEIDGEQKKSFTIGSSGTVKTESERDLIRQKLLQKQGEVSLDMPALKIANEYYTDEEMVKFKKPTKFKKVRKKVKPLKADELLGMTGDGLREVTSNTDLGSRNNERNYRQAVTPQKNFKHPWETEDDSRDDMDLDDDSENLGPDEDFVAALLEPDEAELELQMALNKSRKLKQMEERNAKSGGGGGGGGGRPNLFLSGPMTWSGDDNSQVKVKKEMDDGDNDGDEEEEAGKGSIVLNSTAEFCRALGDIPTYGMSGNRDEDVDDLMDYDAGMYGDGKIKGDERGVDSQDIDAEDDSYKEGWNEVKPNTNPSAKVKKEDVTILDEEPDVGTGIAGALQLAMKKGYLEQEVKKVVSAPRHTTLEAASYTIEDKNFMEDDRQGRRERYATGPVTDFRDKDNYRPEVKLEYIDDGGRLLKPKEAFRYLSHKFHGKGSGKNKTEKRMKKVQEESLMRQMSSTDTPLGTLALLQDKQKQTQSPYIVLSGGSKAINPSIISKTK